MLATYARHPQLTRLCERLASMSRLTTDEAVVLVEAAARAAGISMLDIEMVQPGADARVPFAPMSSAAPGGEFSERVRHHLHTRINGATQ